MKLFKYLTLVILLGTASAAYGSSIDPTIITRGGGGSEPVTGLVFGGSFPTPDGPLNCEQLTNVNCFENANPSNDYNTFTFIAIHLFFASSEPLTYTCQNGSEGYVTLFTSCNVSGNEVTFSGINNDGYNDPFGCFPEQGITTGCHFEIAIVGLPGGVTDSFTGVADTPFVNGSTPEPASGLLFVIAIGAVAVFFKRA